MNTEPEPCPADIEAEQAVLGSCLIDSAGAMGRLEPLRLAADDFYLPAHRMIWNAMQVAKRRGEPTDIVVIANELTPVLDEIGGVAYLASLSALTPTSLNAVSYGRLVRERADERRLIDMGLVLQGPARLNEKKRHIRLMLERMEERSAPESDEPAYKLATVPSMADIQREEIHWLWKPYVPRGRLTIIEGDPGVRKSWLTLAIATAVSRGARLPGDLREGAGPQRTLLLSGEDGLGDTVRPRLEGLGADLTQIRPVLGLLNLEQTMPLTLSADGVRALEYEVREYRPLLVIIDPLLHYTPAGTDTNNALEVRGLLKPLMDLAERYEFALVAVRHWSKAPGVSATYKGQGSIDYFAAARCVYAVGVDKSDAGLSVMAPTKSMTERPAAIGFRIGEAAMGFDFLWESEVAMDVDDMLAPADAPAERTALAQAKEFLRDMLMAGPRRGTDVQKEAREAGHSHRTLERAKAELGIVSRRTTGEKPVWNWIMPLADGTLPPEISPDTEPGIKREEPAPKGTPEWWSDIKDDGEEV